MGSFFTALVVDNAARKVKIESSCEIFNQEWMDIVFVLPAILISIVNFVFTVITIRKIHQVSNEILEISNISNSRRHTDGAIINSR